jgi:hypothetical protein
VIVAAGGGANATVRFDWQVWRHDDARDSFLVAADLDEATARRLRDSHERRGHKQRYWVRRGGDTQGKPPGTGLDRRQ